MYHLKSYHLAVKFYRQPKAQGLLPPAQIHVQPLRSADPLIRRSADPLIRRSADPRIRDPGIALF